MMNIHIRPFKCGYCSKAFGFKEKLDRHEFMHHLKGKLSKDDPRQKRDDYETELIECDICSQKIPRSRLNYHKKKHNKDKFIFECNICNKKFVRRESYTYHMTTHKERTERKIFECKICSKTFLQRSALKYHEVIHLKDSLPADDPRIKYLQYSNELVECEICSKSVLRKNLRTHEKIHTNEKPFK